MKKKKKNQKPQSHHRKPPEIHHKPTITAKPAIPPLQTTGNPPQTTINNSQTHHHSKTHSIKTKNKPKTNKSKPTNQTNKSKNKPTLVLIESGSGASFDRRPVLETQHRQQSNPWQTGARVPRLTGPRNASPSFAVPRRFVLRQRFELVLAVLSAPLPSKAAISTQSQVKSRPRSRPSPSPSSGPKLQSQHMEPIEQNDRTNLVTPRRVQIWGSRERELRPDL